MLVPRATVKPAPVEPPVKVPTEVNEEPTTATGNAVPVKVFAAAVTVMLADPSKLTPLMVLGVCKIVALPAFPVTLDWSPVLLPDTLDVPATVNVNVPVASVPLPVILTPFKVVAVASPRIGVISVGLVFMTNLLPVPVCDATLVALPTLVMGPVKLALVVTFPDVKPAAVPVQFVKTPEVGVPNSGLTSVGLVLNTLLPVPVPSDITPNNCRLVVAAN